MENKGVKKMRIIDFLLFLALYAPAPKNAPKDWFHHAEENFNAWKQFLDEAKERGYFEVPTREVEQ